MPANYMFKIDSLFKPVYSSFTLLLRKNYPMPFFFVKRRFLVDYLDGFIDIHNHILPAIDDGAKTVDESMQLLRSFAEIGVSRFICTPHIMNDYYPNTPTTIFDALESLKNRMLQADLKHIAIEAAAEHMIDGHFDAILENGGFMPLKSHYLLVEMSYLQPPLNFDEAIIKIVSKRFFPILAHPERYGFLHKKPKKYAKFKQQGILLQLNMLSLSGYYGKDVQKVGHTLLEDGFIDFLASDVHNILQLESLKNLTLSKKSLEQLLPIIGNTIERFY